MEEKKKKPILVGIIMGSPTDLKKGEEAKAALDDHGIIGCAVTYASAHRSPERLRKVVNDFTARGCEVFVVLAGWAAHLAGAVAAMTVKPVIGVPLSSSPLNGMDALLSTVQMPKGIPVATVAVDAAANGAILAVQILATKSEGLTTTLIAKREKMALKLDESAKDLAEISGYPG